MAHQFRQAAPLAGAAAPLGHRPVEVDEGDVLEAAAPVRVDDVAPPLPAESDDRAALSVRGNDAGEHVGCAGADAAGNHRRFPPDAGPSFRHVGRGGFMARIDETHAVFIQFGEKGVEAPVQNSEDDADPFRCQRFQEQFASGDFSHNPSHGLRNWRTTPLISDLFGGCLAGCLFVDECEQREAQNEKGGDRKDRHPLTGLFGHHE